MRPIAPWDRSRVHPISRYRRDMAVARARLAGIERTVAETAGGAIEYAERGEGVPALVSHGVLGGFHAGLWTARHVLGESGFRVVAPSRFGYLRTPMPAGATPASQADAFAGLLDHLGIDRAVVVGFSAGGTSSIHFAFRHPERTLALVLVSSNVPGPHVEGAPRALKPLFHPDPAWWLFRLLLPGPFMRLMGVPKRWQLTPDDEALVTEVADSLFPVSDRAQGFMFDVYASNPDINRPFVYGDMRVPTLVVHSRDDPLAPYAGAPTLVARMRGSQLVTLERGGHLNLGGAAEQMRTAVADFLAELGVRPSGA